MCIIRVTAGAHGLAQYLRTGQKIRRMQTRNTMDQRVPLLGDLAVFESAVKYSQRVKRWRDHYWHLTIGFAQQDSLLSDETLRQLPQDVLSYYFGLYSDSDGLVSYAEAHLPRVQTTYEDETGKSIQRLPHIHIGVAKYNVVTGNAVRCLPYHQRSSAAFQSWLALKHGLTDPALHRRHRVTAPERAGMKGANAPDQNQQNLIAIIQRELAELLSACTTQQDARDKLATCPLGSEIEAINAEKGNYRWLRVKSSDSMIKTWINLRGPGFDHLYASPSPKSVDWPNAAKVTAEALQVVWQNHIRWFEGQQYEAVAPQVINHEAVALLLQEKASAQSSNTSPGRTAEQGDRPASSSGTQPTTLTSGSRQPEAVVEQFLVELMEMDCYGTCKESIQTLDSTVDARHILHYASRHFALEGRHYKVTSGNRIADRRIPGESLTCSEFLQRVCHRRAIEVVVLLTSAGDAGPFENEEPPTEYDADTLAEDADHHDDWHDDPLDLHYESELDMDECIGDDWDADGSRMEA
ncbi:hypothetical protein J2T57_004461 [Natronocella acetinitrilica]|uniref:Uncharacterized protein n=1 Tax=Natronocella acetinitrilica TaxID=414046 RepID=A0AAE3G8B8_9GAMM|nr:hypothetical protein [Natronocella acetinitrilica]MCP1677282.1 hypothetical protein [Natronocella acetinitrilica]